MWTLYCLTRINSGRRDAHWNFSGRKAVYIYPNGRILPGFGKLPLDRVGRKDVVASFDGREQGEARRG